MRVIKSITMFVRSMKINTAINVIIALCVLLAFLIIIELNKQL